MTSDCCAKSSFENTMFFTRSHFTLAISVLGCHGALFSLVCSITLLFRSSHSNWNFFFSKRTRPFDTHESNSIQHILDRPKLRECARPSPPSLHTLKTDCTTMCHRLMRLLALACFWSNLSLSKNGVVEPKLTIVHEKCAATTKSNRVRFGHYHVVATAKKSLTTTTTDFATVTLANCERED